MRIKLSKEKMFLLVMVLSLVIIGISYTSASAQSFIDTARVSGILIELVPEECQVLETSPGVVAGVEFQHDMYGNIINKTDINMTAKNVYPGAYAEYRITAQNISDIPISIDKFKLVIEQEENSMEELICFSGTVKISRHKEEYYNVLGTFENTALTGLDDILTAIFKYRKIDAGEKIVLELIQQFDCDRKKFAGGMGLSYKLVPVFVQYFPEPSTAGESD